MCLNSFNGLKAQNLSTEGDDFWIGFMENWLQDPGNRIILEVYISSNDSARALIEMPLKSGGFPPIDTLVLPGKTLRIEIPTYLAMSTFTNSPENNGVHISTDADVSVYAMNKRQFSADMAVILPTYTLGNDYMVISHWEDGNRNNNANSDSEFLILSIEDNTKIEITPSYFTNNGKPAGTPFEISLNKGQTYLVKAKGDLTGSAVKAVANTESECNKFAVFAGNMYTKVGECDHPDGHDHLYAQMYPKYTWGKEYITVAFYTRTGGDHVKVIASEDNSDIYLNGNFVDNLQSGEFLFLRELEGVNSITSNKIISVAQFSRSQACDNSFGDPFVVLINPNEQVLHKITFFTPEIATIRNYNLSIIAKTSDVSTVMLNNVSISQYFQLVPGNNDFSYARISVNAGNHTLKSQEGIIAYVYGYGSNESFGYPTGAGLTNLNLNIKVEDEIGEEVPADSICHQIETWFIPETEFDYTEYKWNFGDGTIITTNTPDSVAHTYDKPGKYIVELTGTTGSTGCVSGAEQTSVIVVRVLKPTVSIIGPRSICPNTSDVLYRLDRDNLNYSWFIDGGIINTSLNDDSIKVDWYESNPNAWLKVLAHNNRGCYGDTTLKPIKIKVQLDPDAPFGPDTLCSNDISKILYSTFDLQGTTYEWKVGGGSVIGENGNNTVEIDWDSWGYSQIWFEQLSITDTVCSGISDTLSIYIQRNPSEELIIISDKLEYLIGEPALFKLETDTLYHVASWIFDEERILDSIAISYTPEIPYNCAGNFNIYATVYDTLGICDAQVTANHQIHIKGPEIDIIQVSHENDIQDHLVLQWKTTEAEFYDKPFYLYRDSFILDTLWNVGIPYIDSQVNSDSIIYEYEIFTNQDCQDAIVTRAHNNILLQSEIDSENSEEVVIYWNAYQNWNAGVDSYDLWLNVDNGGFEHIDNLSKNQDEYIFESKDLGFEHCFKLIANESAGNSAYSWSNISCVTFVPFLFPYNIITPNNDDKNETFWIENIEHYPNSVLTIFNRWGQKIYETRGYGNNWGGKYNGQILPNSTYYYVLELNEPRADRETINGTITILR